tara:strand:+ start:143 stop:367 length:225 start_codon:yes stop_codon:yes gene_type:complete
MDLKKKKGQYRFFYHYYKQYKKMSFHFKNEKCMIVDDVVCNVPCETKWSETQPNLVMRGWATGYELINNTLIIF